MENGKHIRVLTIRYQNEIKQHEIPLFRGAINAAMGGNADVLFHNHSGDNYRYSYPLIQYKRIGGKAAIVCVAEGAGVIGQFLATDCKSIKLGDKSVMLEIDTVIPRRLMVQTWQSSFNYTLRHWLPLNSDNYRIYMQSESMTERISLLERILTGNLLSMAKGLGINMLEEISVRIGNIEKTYAIRHKDIKMIAFDLVFTCNMSIPNHIGLGKNASHGYGVVMESRKRKEDNSKTI